MGHFCCKKVNNLVNLYSRSLENNDVVIPFTVKIQTYLDIQGIAMEDDFDISTDNIEFFFFGNRETSVFLKHHFL